MVLRLPFVIAFIALLNFQASYSQIQITIDKTKQYQTIDGFGGFGARDVPWSGSGPLYNDTYIKKIVNDLGLTISRTQVPTTFEMVNDNNDPFNTDLSKYNVDKDAKQVFGNEDACKGEHMPLNSQTPWMAAMNDEGKRNGETIKFVASVWSPPYWMKYTKCYFGNDPSWHKLIMSEIQSAENPNDRKDEYAEYCVAFIRKVKEMTKTTLNPNGIDLYAISLQNEPAFGQLGFSSSIYTPAELARVIRHVGKRFEKEGIKTKIFWPEDIGDLGRFAQYVNAVNSDPTIRPYGHIGAVHAYNANGTIAGSQNQTLWDAMYRTVNRYGPKPFWQTETSGYYKVPEKKDAEGKIIQYPEILWGGGMNLATTMQVALKHGKVSAWLFWSIGNSSNINDGYQFLHNDQPNINYYVSKHFYKFIRPGAVQVDASTADASVLPVAFQHNDKKTLTLVVINQDSVKSKTIKLNFPDGTMPPSTFTRYETSSPSLYDVTPSTKAENKGTVSATSTIVLPPNSITTLVGTNSSMVTSIEEETKSELAYMIYPNPASNYLTIASDIKSEKVNVEITDVTNRSIKQTEVNFNNGDVSIDISDLINGVYFVRMNNVIKQFIVAK